MQMNGGFFGSMMPQGANSFMPQGPSSASMVGGIDGTPQGMTSPPISQQLLAALAALSKMGGGQNGSQDGGPSALPPNSFSPFMPNGGQPPQQPAPAGQGAPGGGSGAPMGMGQLNPDMIRALLAKLGIGGAPGGGGAP